MESATAVCRHCKRRFPLSLRSNQYHRRTGEHHKAARFCGAACKQAAYRKRNAEKAHNGFKSAQGPDTHATVTGRQDPSKSPNQINGLAEANSAHLKVLGPAEVVETEVFAPHHWENCVSSGGVRIQVAQLRKSFLQRRSA
jgi:hypothetical protein